MLTQAFTKKSLFGATAIAGVTALLAVSPSYAQSTAAPTGGDPQSPAANAPPSTSPDPARVAPNSDDENQVDSPAEEATEDDEGEVEAVVVTGSRIRRNPTNAPAPLIQVGRQEILQSGEPNIIDFLADIPALQTSFTPEDQTTGGLSVGGLSLLDLRNLGTERTLVLVDSRRHVGSNIGALEVDVDTIPSLLIENIEVVTGGQSALYGADAVSGVVNFILRRNFEGIEVDGVVAQINQDGQLSGKLSGVIGHNFLDDRLNVYAFAEYQDGEEVRQTDVDFLREANFLNNNDTDQGTFRPDGQLDFILIRDARDAFFARGGVLILANQVRPSTGFLPGTTLIADPDFTIQNCGPVPSLANRPFTGISGFCTNIAPENNSTFVFGPDGRARPFNFGTFQDQNGNSRRINSGGDGLNSNTEFGNETRLPEQTSYRFQTGLNFDVTDDIQIFAEAKFVRDETNISNQASFFQLPIVDIPAGTQGGLLATSAFTIGLDNPFLDPAIVARIRSNTRPVFDLRQTLPNPVAGGPPIPNPAFGNQTGTIADPRALLGLFGPSRIQNSERELERYVLGLRGDRDRLGFLDNLSYEIGYTYGEARNSNVENALDVERFFFGADAVRNAAGQIVCRVQDLAARGIPLEDQTGVPGRSAILSPTAPQVTGCTPINVFGADFRSDANGDNITGGGGRPGLTQAQADYILASVNVQEKNRQQDFLAFVSAETFDFFGAGPIGVALGYEYREEKFEGIGRDTSNLGRLLFLNGSFDNPEVGYDSNEIFGEIQVPLLRNSRFGRSAEISAAYRRAENSVESVGESKTYSLQAQYRPTSDVLFRATFGTAVRIPTLNDLFNTGFQTFALINDPCDANSLRAQTNPTIQANRRRNCAALLGPGYDPDLTQIIYDSSAEGAGGAGNSLLESEESRSFTYSISLTPRFIPRLSLVVDYYDIAITNAIQSIGINTNIANCVSGEVLNLAACNSFTRNGAAGRPTVPGQEGRPFNVISFLEGSQNFAATKARGIDFNAAYSIDTADLFARDFGRIDYSIRGNYLIRQEDFVNLNDPLDATENDSLPGQPRVRFLSKLTLSPFDALSVTWDWDWQSSQEIVDSAVFVVDPDNRDAAFAETGSFSQHDFSFRYEIRDGFTLRGGVINAFDEEPAVFTQGGAFNDIFDIFGRRFFIGGNVKLGAATGR